MTFERIIPTGKHGGGEVPADKVAITITDHPRQPVIAVRLGADVVDCLGWKDGQHVDVFLGDEEDAGRIMLQANVEGGAFYVFRGKTRSVSIGTFPGGKRPGKPRHGQIVAHERAGEAIIVTLPDDAFAAKDQAPSVEMQGDGVELRIKRYPAPVRPHNNPKSSDFPETPVEVKPGAYPPLPEWEKLRSYLLTEFDAGRDLPQTRLEIAEAAGVSLNSLQYLTKRIADTGVILEKVGGAWCVRIAGAEAVAEPPAKPGISVYSPAFQSVIDWLRTVDIEVTAHPSRGLLFQIDGDGAMTGREVVAYANAQRRERKLPAIVVDKVMA